ncbi:MFS transporter [Lentzea sp. NPDC059081]|uniref:MFS transporter n=1 Tax=Lentzea sp. NPDC059081 TaxID=3346719 RepID=UPI0036D13748
MSVHDTRATFAHVLTRPVFRELLATRVIAIAADVLRTVALSTTIFTTTGSPLLAALAFGLAFVPQAFTGVLFGALTDRVRPRTLIVGSYLVSGTATGLLGLVTPPTWVVLTVITLIGCLGPALNGTSGRLVADVLDGDAYVLGRSVMSMAMSFAQLGGLAVGGLAVAAFGVPDALMISAAAVLGSGVVARLLLPDLPAAPGDGNVVRQGLTGTRQLLADRTTRTLLLAQWLPPAFVVGAESLLVSYALDRGFTTGAAGLMLAALPVGMIVGEFLVARFLAPATRQRVVPALIALLGLPLPGLAFDLPVAACCALLVVSGAGFAYGLGIAAPFRDAVPEERRGQSFTVLSAGLMTAQGLGPAVWGAVAEVVPIGHAIAAAGVVTVLTAVVFRSVPAGPRVSPPPGRPGPSPATRG